MGLTSKLATASSSIQIHCWLKSDRNWKHSTQMLPKLVSNVMLYGVNMTVLSPTAQSQQLTKIFTKLNLLNFNNLIANVYLRRSNNTYIPDLVWSFASLLPADTAQCYLKPVKHNTYFILSYTILQSLLCKATNLIFLNNWRVDLKQY